MTSRIISKKIQELPAELENELLDYIEFLIRKYGSGKSDKAFSFNWENGLSILKDQFTSVDLQHKAMEWR
jgi:hypothetical protein